MTIEITKYQQAVQQREALSAQHSALLDSVVHAMFGIDSNGKCTFINARAAELLGYSVKKCMHSDMMLIVDKGFRLSPEHHHRLYRSVLWEGNQVRDEQLFTRPDGTTFWIGYQARPMSTGNEITGAIITFADITDKRHDEERLTYHARHDTLTGLPNRSCF